MNTRSPLLWTKKGIYSLPQIFRNVAVGKDEVARKVLNRLLDATKRLSPYAKRRVLGTGDAHLTVARNCTSKVESGNCRLTEKGKA